MTDLPDFEKKRSPRRARTRGARSEHESAGEGTAPSITVPSNAPVYALQCLGHGVDSLYVSHKGRLKEVYQQILSDLKSMAQSEDLVEQNQAQLPLNGHTFEIKPKGRGKHPFVIVDNAFHTSICDGQGSVPYAYTQISSEYLSHVGVEKALQDLWQCVDDMAEYVSYAKPSRVDIHLDVVADYPFHLLGEESFSSRCRGFTRHADNGFQGLTIGKGDFVFRLYDKTKEIKVSKKYYMRDIWKQAGWDGKSPVYRLEFQLRGQFLKKLGILTIEDLLPKIAEIWAHCCKHRLRLLAPSGHQSKHRHPTEPLWDKVTWALGAYDALPLKKDYSYKRIPPDYYLFGHGLAPVLSYMAVHDIHDLEEGFRAFREGLMRYHRMRESDPDAFERYVRRKIAERQRKYNVKLNPPDDEGDAS